MSPAALLAAETFASIPNGAPMRGWFLATNAGALGATLATGTWALFPTLLFELGATLLLFLFAAAPPASLLAA